MKRTRGALPPGAALPALLGLALALRLVWPLADPAERLSWSNGTYTDPAAITHAARNAVLFGEWIRDESRDLLFYPLLNALTWIGYSVFGPGRIVTQVLSALLGTAAVAGAAWAVARARGRDAGLLTAGVLGCGFWLAMFSRVPVAENLVAALLAPAAAVAVGRGRAAAVLAGTLAGVAACFGKVHAAAFLPALLAFVALRERRVTAMLPVLAGFALPAAAWFVFLFLPNRAEFLAQAAGAEELYGALPVLRAPGAAATEALWALRASWLFHRWPVIGALGLLFAAGTLLDPETRRRRFDDGTALFVLWFLAAWLLITALPYKAPRYYVPAVLPLGAAGACFLHDLATGRARLGRAATVAGIVAVAFSAVDAFIHVLALVDDRLIASKAPAAAAVREWALRLAGFLRPPSVHAGAALWIAAAAAWLVFRPLAPVRALRRIAPARAAAGLLAASLLLQTLQFADWAGRRVYAVEETKRSVAAVTRPEAVLYGQFAPVLVQDGPRTGVPLFGAAARGTLERHAVTHVVLGSSADAEAMARAEPELARRLTRVGQWSFRTRHLRSLQLYRLRGAPYEPTAFETAAEEMEQGRFAPALEALAAFRAAGAPDVRDVPAAEAQCLFSLGDLDAARRRLEEAVRIGAGSPQDWFNLGNLLRYQGDPAGARRAWERALALDPWDGETAARLRELEGGAAR